MFKISMLGLSLLSATVAFSEEPRRPADANISWAKVWLDENEECSMAIIIVGTVDNIRLPLMFEVDDNFYAKDVARSRFQAFSEHMEYVLRAVDFTEDEQKYWNQITFNIGMKYGVMFSTKIAMGNEKDVDVIYRSCLRNFGID